MVKKRLARAHKKIKHGASKAKEKVMLWKKWILFALILIILLVIMNINRIEFSFL